MKSCKGHLLLSNVVRRSHWVRDHYCRAAATREITLEPITGDMIFYFITRKYSMFSLCTTFFQSSCENSHCAKFLFFCMDKYTTTTPCSLQAFASDLSFDRTLPVRLIADHEPWTLYTGKSCGEAISLQKSIECPSILTLKDQWF